MAYRDYQEYLSRKDSQSFQILAGLGSILSGVLIAGAVIYLLPRNLSSLEKARELGIISRSVVDGYPKASEIQYYVLGVIVSLLSGLSIFLGITYSHYKKRSLERTAKESLFVYDGEMPKPRMGLLRWGALVVVLFLATFHTDFIYKNWYWSDWGFFFEEGIYLRWINDLLKGRILYKDIYFYGGPFMLWPQYWLMKLCGPSIAINRYYVYFCYLVGYLIVFKVLRETIRNRIVLSVGVVLIVYFYYPMFPGFHRSLGRFAFALLPLYFLYKYFFRKGRLYLLISGVCSGLALLFSQELGISALIAALAMLAAFDYREGETIKNLVRQFSLIGAGIFVALLPVLGYFALHRALGDLYETVIAGTRYYTLGIWGYSFPSLFQLIKNPAASRYDVVETLLAYWPILFYVCSVFFFLALFLRKSFSNRHILYFGIAALGGMIFQRALGIYYLFQIGTLIYPLVILSVAYLDMAWPRVRTLFENGSVTGRTIETSFYVVALVFITSGLYGYSQARAFYPAARPLVYLTHLKRSSEGFVPLDLPRARNIYVPPKEADEIRCVVDYIKEKTTPEEPVYVFPFSPTYYFLADRVSPVKYPVAHTTTRKYREETIEKLEEEKVRYVIYIMQGPSLGLTPEMRYPEITDYIFREYAPEKRCGRAIISRRKKRSEP